MADRFSRLSDDILCHILSFLRTEQAVATSVLSKRWTRLWTLVPILDFDNQPYLQNRKPSFHFERLIYATILARDAALQQRQPIRTFRLRYEILDHERAAADVSVWVSAAVQRGVENLEIELDTKAQGSGLLHIITLRSDIFSSSKTLVFLKLKEVYLSASSSVVDLPLLKSLHLQNVRFDEPQHFMDLLCGCPMLEDLKTNYVDYDYDSPIRKERVKNLSKLVRADLRFVGLDYMEEDFKGTNILLKAISNVQFLTIKDFEEFGLGDDNVVAEFPNLTYLALSLPPFKNPDWLLLMLKNCPKLQSFKLDVSFEDEEDDLPNPDFVPECLTSCLTKCYLKCFQGTKGDLQFAKYILQNSTNLQSMKIRRVSPNILEFSPNPLEVLEELALCPVKSASCELLLKR